MELEGLGRHSRRPHVVIAAWLGVISALIVIVGVLVGFLIGAIIDGDVGFHMGKGTRVR